MNFPSHTENNTMTLIKGDEMKKTTMTKKHSRIVISAISQWKLKCCLIAFWRSIQKLKRRKNLVRLFSQVLANTEHTGTDFVCHQSTEIFGAVRRRENLSCNITRTHHKLLKNFSFKYICSEDGFFFLFPTANEMDMCARYTKNRVCV